jgi:squalene synthase HpnC
LALLKWWEQELRECYAGRVRHPVFVALRQTIDQFQIPIHPLLDLLVAFRQDQSITRYDTLEQLLDYCRYSANPVGRLVLYLGQCCDPQRAQLSDQVCTGLQLANFCQDVARDWDLGRVYLPHAECARYKYDEAMFARREANDAFRRLMAAQVKEAEGWLRRGAALVPLMPPSLRLAIALFVEGGLSILEEIRRQDYDVWSQRPTVSRQHKLRLLAKCWWRIKRGQFPERPA